MSAVMEKWGSEFKIRFAPVEGKKPAGIFHDANLSHLELEEFIHASGVSQSAEDSEL